MAKFDNIKVNDILNDFSNCLRISDCEHCRASIKLEGSGLEKTGETFCDLLRAHNNRLMDKIEEIL